MEVLCVVTEGVLIGMIIWRAAEVEEYRLEGNVGLCSNESENASRRVQVSHTSTLSAMIAMCLAL